MKFYVYVYRDPSHGNEPIYVGKGLESRPYDHLTREDIHPFVQRLQLMKRGGIEPIINVVDMPSEEMAFQCEIDTIARFGRKNLGLGPLLNLTDGGEGFSGYIPSAETRKKQSDAKKGEKNHNYGKSRPPTTRQKNIRVKQRADTVFNNLSKYI